MADISLYDAGYCRQCEEGLTHLDFDPVYSSTLPCHRCGQVTNAVTIHDNRQYCDDCIAEVRPETTYCTMCSSPVDPQWAGTLHGKFYCIDCTKELQRKANIPADGTLGPKTIAALQRLTTGRGPMTVEEVIEQIQIVESDYERRVLKLEALRKKMRDVSLRVSDDTLVEDIRQEENYESLIAEDKARLGGLADQLKQLKAEESRKAIEAQAKEEVVRKNLISRAIAAVNLEQASAPAVTRPETFKHVDTYTQRGDDGVHRTYKRFGCGVRGRAS